MQSVLTITRPEVAPGDRRKAAVVMMVAGVCSPTPAILWTLAPGSGAWPCTGGTATTEYGRSSGSSIMRRRIFYEQ